MSHPDGGDSPYIRRVHHIPVCPESVDITPWLSSVLVIQHFLINWHVQPARYVTSSTLACDKARKSKSQMKRFQNWS